MVTMGTQQKNDSDAIRGGHFGHRRTHCFILIRIILYGPVVY
jgi:hypothetical protein